MTEHSCGCITYDSGPPVCCPAHPNGPAPLVLTGVVCDHHWVTSTTVFDDEPGVARMTEHCKRCPAWRGRT